MAGGIALMIVLGIFLILGFAGYYQVRRRVRSFSREVFGTDNIMKGLREVQEEANNTPYSISGGNSIYLPRVEKDFPDFHKSVLEEKVKEFLFSYFDCLENLDISKLSQTVQNEAVLVAVESELADLKESGIRKRYDNIKLHAISISNYTKSKEYATVKYQVALEYTDTSKIQTKYEIHCTFTFKDTGAKSFGIRCRHCGGPLETTSTVCEYCGTIVIRNINKVWIISNYKKIK